MTASAAYHPVLATVAAQPIAAVAARVRPEQMGEVVFRALDSVHAALRTGDYGPYWGDVVLCEGEADGVLDLRIGVGLARDFPGMGAVAGWRTPGGEAVLVTHLGAWSEREGAHAAARDGAARLGRRLTGVHWEVHGPFLPKARARQTDVFYEATHA
ncbi:MAG: hypothetical protein U1C74_14030 [Phenylobacterium sp.]|nr:hypothetical protein [Phenylobacterium sp.]